MPETNARIYGHLCFGPGAEIPSDFRTEDDGRCGDVGGAWRTYHNGFNTRPDLDGSHPAGTAQDFAGLSPVPAVQPPDPDCAVQSQPEIILEVNGQLVTGQGDVGPAQLALDVDCIEGEVDLLPPGFCVDFAGDYIPAGYLERNGQIVLIDDYPDLYAVLGTTWGGDGVTTFGIPNDIGRVSIGAGDDGAGHVYSVGQYGGAVETVLITDNLPGYLLDVLDVGHIHGVTDPGHDHPTTDPGHVHALTDPGHVHALTDPGHAHNTQTAAAGGAVPQLQPVNLRLGLSPIANNFTTTNTTGLTVDSASTGITVGLKVTALTVDDNTTGLTINTASTGIQVSSKGLDVPIDRRMPYSVKRKLIKY